jgi:peptidyl-prolyl cis-trans isomerase C
MGEDKPVVKVGKYTIFLSEFTEKYKPRDDVDRDSLKQAVLDEMIADKCMLIDAYEKGLEEKVQDQMKSYRNRIMVGKLYDRAVVQRVKVSPWDVRSEWWHTGTTLKLSQIIVKDKSKLSEIYRELREGVAFADIARKYSTDHQAKYGGDIGQVKWGQLEPKLQRVAFRLQAGDISRPVKMRDEYRIVKVTERKDIKGRDFDKEKDKIESGLKRKEQGKLASTYLDHVRKFAHPKYDMEVIEQVTQSLGDVDKNKVIMRWVGGEITVGYFAEKADRELNMGRLGSPESIKAWLRNHLTYEILLPIQAARHHLHKLPDVMEQLTKQEETLLFREYQNVEIDGKVSITDEDVREYYDTHRDTYEGEFEKSKSRVRWDVEREKKKEKREEVIKDLRARIEVDVISENLKEI